jgi:hypothetical protein
MSNLNLMSGLFWWKDSHRIWAPFLVRSDRHGGLGAFEHGRRTDADQMRHEILVLVLELRHERERAALVDRGADDLCTVLL